MKQVFTNTKSYILLLMAIIISSLMIQSCEDSPTDTDEPNDTAVMVDELSGQLIDEYDNILPDAIVELYYSPVEITADLGVPIAVDTADKDGNFMLEFSEAEIARLKLRLRHAVYGRDTDIDITDYLDKIKNKEKLALKIKEKKECAQEVTVKVNLIDGTLADNDKLLIMMGEKRILLAKQSDNADFVTNLCPGMYRFSVKQGQKIYAAVAEVGENTATIELELKQEEGNGEECCDNSLRLVVTDEQENPIKGAVVILKKGNKAIADPRTNDNGVVEIGEICKGDGYYVVIEREGYERIERELEAFDCEDARNLTIKMKAKEGNGEECCDNVLRVRVTDKDGKAISGAKVLLRRDGKAIEDPRTNSDGWATIDGICKGEKYDVLVQAEGYKLNESERFAFECKGVKEIELKLEAKEGNGEECCDNSLRLVVTDEQENPIKGAVVILKKGNKAIADPRTNENGVVEIGEICKGDGYYVVIEREGYERIERELEAFDCEDARNLTIKMKAKEGNGEECCDNVLRVRVTDKDGKAISGAKVLLRKDGKAIEDPRTNSDGWATIDGICKGEKYDVLVQAEGYKLNESERFTFECKGVKEIEIKLEAK